MIGVIDTSALIRLYIPDGAIPRGFEEFLRGVERGNNMAIAPELHLVEFFRETFYFNMNGILSDHAQGRGLDRKFKGRGCGRDENSDSGDEGSKGKHSRRE